MSLTLSTVAVVLGCIGVIAGMIVAVAAVALWRAVGRMMAFAFRCVE